MQRRSRRVETLLEEIRRGDPRAFTHLVRELEPFVRSASMKVCRDRDTADENAQDTFVALHRGLAQFTGASSFTTWLYAVIVNNCRMKHRRRRIDRESVPLESVETPAARATHGLEGPEARMLRGELQAILGTAIEELPEEYRPVFVLRQLERLSTQQTAEALGLTQAAVKSRLHRARAMVRRSVERQYAEAA